MKTRESIAYPVLMVLGALDAAGYSVMAAGAAAIARATGAGPALIGALVASFPVVIMVGFLLAPPGVKKGRSTAVLLVSLGLVALGSLGFVAGHTLEIYFAARLVMGLGSGGVWIGVTFGTLERWPGQEYLCMSRIFSAYAVGAMVGPALGAIGGIRAPFLAYLALLCASAILVVLMEDPPRTGPSGLISGRFGCPASGSPRPRFSSSCSRSGPWTASSRCISLNACPRRRSAPCTPGPRSWWRQAPLWRRGLGPDRWCWPQRRSLCQASPWRALSTWCRCGSSRLGWLASGRGRATRARPACSWRRSAPSAS